MAVNVCPYRARVWNGARLVADSTAAIRDERPEQAPVLWFPIDDVRADVVADAAVMSEHGDGALTGYVRLDGGTLRTELLEVVDGDGQMAATRFPNWGDAADLIDMMDVRPIGEGHFVSVARSDWRRPVVEASQILGQTIVAAMRETGGRRVVTASMIFVRAADARVPLTFVLEILSNGRTFSAVRASVEQNDRLCASGTLLLDVTAPDIIRHTVAMPDVPGPDECPPLDMGVTGRDLRVVDGAYTGDPDAPVGPPVLDAWVRFRTVPDDAALHAGVLTQFTGHMSIGAALRAHAGVGEQQAHVTLSTGINAISISFHRDVRVDRWMLYHHLSTSAADGMTHSECRVHDVEGDLLASFTVDGMVRAFSGSATGNYRSSM